MKIAFVVGGLPFGGIENQLLSITKYMNQNKTAEPVVINISGTGERINDFIAAGIELINVASSLKAIKVQSISTVFKLRKVLKDVKPDIIHTSHFSADYFTRLAAIGLGIPVITQIHNIKVEKKAHRRFINKILSYATDRYTTVSHAVDDYVTKAHNIAKKEQTVLYNAIDFSDKQLGHIEKSSVAPENSRVITSVGRLVKQKNVGKLIEGFALVHKQLPDTHLLIVGEGGLKESLINLANNLGISENVTFAGYRTDVMELLSISDIFALPSEFEGFGNAHLEAMFMGLPAIISDKVPTKEFAADAVVICGTEPEQIADGLIQILSDKTRYDFMSKRAKEIASDFTMDNYIPKLMKLYEDVLEKYN